MVAINVVCIKKSNKVVGRKLKTNKFELLLSKLYVSEFHEEYDAVYTPQHACLMYMHVLLYHCELTSGSAK